jgi:MFS family permease
MSSTPAAAPDQAAGHPLKIGLFRNLWIAATISLLGDQFFLVALPWLVLQLSGSGLALGTVLMAEAVPRAALMLVGGAVTDRFLPRTVLIATGVVRVVLVAAIAALTGLGAIRLWHIYVLACAFGVADAFSFPASTALLPSLVRPEQYAAADSMLQGSAQLSTMIGPAPAGFAIKHWGLASAFWFDAISFLGPILVLLWVPDQPRQPIVPPAGSAQPGMLRSIADGLRYVVQDPALRLLFVVSTVLNLCVAGPLAVGLAVMANLRFRSAADYGILISCFEGGALAGMLLAGALPRFSLRGWSLTALTFATAFTLFGLAMVGRLIAVAVLLAVMGMCTGFVNIQIMSWLQSRVKPDMLGRLMSVLMFSAVGLTPISFVVAGAVAEAHLAALFLAAGALVLITAFTMVFTAATRAIA